MGYEKLTGKGEKRAAQWSWDIAPDPIPEDQIVNTIESEVLIIGAGNAGVHAALSCVENGLDVVVIEKSNTVNARGGSTGSYENHLHREQDVHVNRDRAQYLWIRSSGNRVNEKLVSLWFERSGEAFDWMSKNVKEVDPNVQEFLISAYGDFTWFPEEPDNTCIVPSKDFDVDDEVFQMNQGNGKFFYVPTAAHYHLCKHKYHVPFYFETIAQQLLVENGRVVGCVAKDAEGYKKYLGTKGVILCTGDISGDPEMMEAFAEPIANGCYANKYVPKGVNTGDGHKMAMWIGAAIQPGPFPLIIHPEALSMFSGPFLFVNKEGKRFMNEATWIQGKAVEFCRQPGKYAWSIFDSNFTRDTKDSLNYGGGMFWDSLAGKYGEPFNEPRLQAEVERYIERGTAYKADTLEELADLIGVEKENFLAEVARYNAMCEAGEDKDFCKDPHMLYPIVQGPFYATKNGTAMMAVPGGIRITERMECLDKEGNIIPGLYASGNASGDLYAQDYPIHVSATSNGRCLTWGYLLGRFLAGVE